MSSTPDRMLPPRIRRSLVSGLFGSRIYYYPETDSTNDAALDLARRDEPEGTIVVTDFQRRGKGRSGHTWTSAPGRDVLFSLILRPPGDTRAALPLTLALAPAVAISLGKLLDTHVGVKWPNDIVTSHGKIAGILAEGASQGGKSDFVVVGVGINVNTSPADFPESARMPVDSCTRAAGGVVFDRAHVLADVLAAMESFYVRFRADGFASLKTAFEERHVLTDRTITFEREGRAMTGRVVGVGADGGLLVRSDDGATITLYGETVTEIV